MTAVVPLLIPGFGHHGAADDTAMSAVFAYREPCQLCHASEVAQRA